MRVVSAKKNIVQLAFPTRKEITMTMGRVQEFYESSNPDLQGKYFTEEQFLDAFMTDDGVVEYFDRWVGFNVPGFIMNNWFMNVVPNKREREMFRLVDKSLTDKWGQYYVIATLDGDDRTLDHEYAHAFYSTDHWYRRHVRHKYENADQKIKAKMREVLSDLGYNSNVFVDEINAYLSTGDERYLQERFGIEIDFEHRQPFVDLFNLKLKEYQE